MWWESVFGIWWVDSEYWPRQAVSLSLEPAIAEASREYCPIAQLAERLTLDQEVPGSNPGRAAKLAYKESNLEGSTRAANSAREIRPPFPRLMSAKRE